MHDYISAQRDYIRAIKPYLDQKHTIYSSVRPKLKVFPDGRVEHEYDLTGHQIELLKILDKAIELVKNNFNWKKYDY